MPGDPFSFLSSTSAEGINISYSEEEINKYNLNLLGVVPMDENIYEYDSNGKPLVDLPDDSPSKVKFHEILSKLNI